MSSIWKNKLGLSIFGQSHSGAIGMTLEGIPAGEAVDVEQLQTFLDRRAPGRFPWTTSRREDDIPEFLCGIVDGKTCGAPVTAIIRNNNTRSSDYEELKDIPRPGHADFTAHVKYKGFHDVSGGGHFSGRLTAALCIAGGICLQILERRGIAIGAHITQIGNVYGRFFDLQNPQEPDKETLLKLFQMDFPVLNTEDGERMIEEIMRAKEEGDSVGGCIECATIGLPPGLGDLLFGGLENKIASLVFGIPAVKGIEFGAGFKAASMSGSEHNDPFYWSGGEVKTRTNNHGGILGGISSGMPLIFRVAIKPTPSIGMEQESVSLSKKGSAILNVRGRHDPCIVPRAAPCVEAAAAIAILDALL